MHIKLKTSQGILLEAESTPVKRGGEGAIHRIISGTGPPLVAKLWHFPRKNVSSQQRIQWMIEHSPLKNVSANVQNAIIWPQDLVFRNRKPAGYTMSLVPESIKLFSFIQPQFPDPKWDQKWQKFTVDNGFRNHSRLFFIRPLVKAMPALKKEPLPANGPTHCSKPFMQKKMHPNADTDISRNHNPVKPPLKNRKKPPKPKNK